jgi:hypothetical protein
MADSNSNMRLALIIEAIDHATEVIEKVNAKVETMARPINKVRTALHELGEAVGLERLHEGFERVAESTEKVERAAQKLVELEAYITIGGGAVVEFFRKVGEGSEQIEVMARELGMTTTQFQRLRYAAIESSVSQQAFAEGMGFLSRNIVEALRGNVELERAFRITGVTWDELKHKSPAHVMETIADWMQKFPDKAKEGYIAMTLFGRGGRELIPFLQKGAEEIRELGEQAESLGLVLSHEQIENAVKFQEAFNRATYSVKMMTLSVGAELMPKVTELVEEFNKWWEGNRTEVAEKFSHFLDSLVKNLPAAADAMVNVAKALVVMFGLVNMVAQAMGGWDRLIYVMATVRFIEFGVAFGQLMWNIGKFVPIFGGWMARMTMAAISFGLMLEATPIGWILTGIAALAAAALLIYKYWEPIKTWWLGFWNGLPDVVRRAVKLSIEAMFPMLTMMGKLAERMGWIHAMQAPAQAQASGDFQIPTVNFGAPASSSVPEGWAAPLLLSPRAGQGEARGGAGVHRIDGKVAVQIGFDPNGMPRVKRASTAGPVELVGGAGTLAEGAAQ